MKVLALRGVQSLRQKAVVCDPQNNAESRQEPKNSMPRAVDQQPTAQERSYCRSGTKEKRDLAHHLLGLRRRIHIAHHRPRNHNACAGGQALHGPKENQLADALRQSATHRSQGKNCQAPKHHGPAAKAVRDSTVKQSHEGKPKQIRRQGLLHLQGRCTQRCRNSRKRRQVGVNRKRPEHAQHGQ